MPASSIFRSFKGWRLRLTAIVVLVGLLAGIIALAFLVYRRARGIVAGELSARLQAVGTSALTGLRYPKKRSRTLLRRYLTGLRRDAGLENVFIFDRQLRSIADARPGIAAGKRYDELQLDSGAARAARQGRSQVAEQFDVEGLRFLGAYFPAPTIAKDAVLYLETSVDYLRPLANLRTAFWAAVGLSLILTGGLGAAWWWSERTVGRARRQADQARRLAALGEMAAKVAHEIRNPLAIIRGNSDLLYEETAAGSTRDRVDVILDEVARLDRLIAEFLSLAREAPMQRSRFELSSMVRETVARFSIAREEGGTVELEMPPQPVYLEGDADRLRRVIENLLRNAAEAKPKAAVTVTLRKEARQAILSVADDGPGIAPEVRENVFDPFFSTKDGGTGLGLAIVHQIVTRHGGTIAIGRSPLGGAEVQIRLPNVAATKEL